MNARLLRCLVGFLPQRMAAESVLTCNISVRTMTSDTSNSKSPESLVQKRARLLWQSRKRGIAENCLIFSTFSAKYLNRFNEEQLESYDRILNQPSNEWDIYYWMVGTKPVPGAYDDAIMEMLQKHCRNADKEERFEQPPLNYEPVTGK